MDEDAVLMGRKIKPNDHHGNPRGGGSPPSHVQQTYTHTAPIPVPVIQPNSHLKYRFIHFKKKSVSQKKKVYS